MSTSRILARGDCSRAAGVKTDARGAERGDRSAPQVEVSQRIALPAWPPRACEVTSNPRASAIRAPGGKNRGLCNLLHRAAARRMYQPYNWMLQTRQSRGPIDQSRIFRSAIAPGGKPAICR